MPKQETKFNEEELKVVKSIQEDYITVQHRLGQLSVARIRLDQQSIALDEQEKDIKDTFTKTQNHEKEFIASITEIINIITVRLVG